MRKVLKPKKRQEGWALPGRWEVDGGWWVVGEWWVGGAWWVVGEGSLLKQLKKYEWAINREMKRDKLVTLITNDM